MAYTIWDWEENKNAVIVNYSRLGSRGPSWPGDKPCRMVVRYLGYNISASVYEKGFRVFRNSENLSKKFDDLAKAKQFIINRVNKKRSLF